MSRIVTFTNLFPSALLPTHGLFVYERMRRLAALLGREVTVVAPVPQVPRWLRFGIHRIWARMPQHEVWQGCSVAHPRYRHWPKVGMRRQAQAMAAGAAAVVARLAADGPIVLDAHYLWPDGVAAATLAARLRLPYVLTARGSDIHLLAQDPWIRGQIAAAAAGAAACVAVSADLAARFATVAGLPRDRVQEVRNGVDLDRFQPGDQAAARRALGLPLAARLLLGVGRLVPGKGFALCAEALAALPADVHLVLVGDGPERARIQQCAGTRVHLLGNRPPDEVAMAMRAADLLVLPTASEGWPNVVTEALASGLRVLATGVGGIPQILDLPEGEDLRRGLLLGSRDGAGVAAGVQRLLQVPADPGYVRRYAERFGWQQPIEQLARIFARASGEAA
jgi:glycosyltransferase involved in cell wall biosynthesis